MNEIMYSKDSYRDRIRETLRWPVVWLVAGNDSARRKEVLAMSVWDFLDSAIWALDKITKEVEELR
jgi:hypothetical protein